MSRAKTILDMLGEEKPAKVTPEVKAPVVNEAKDVREVVQHMIDSLNNFNQQASVGELKAQLMPELMKMMKREEKSEMPAASQQDVPDAGEPNLPLEPSAPAADSSSQDQVSDSRSH